LSLPGKSLLTEKGLPQEKGSLSGNPSTKKESVFRMETKKKRQTKKVMMHRVPRHIQRQPKSRLDDPSVWMFAILLFRSRFSEGEIFPAFLHINVSSKISFCKAKAEIGQLLISKLLIPTISKPFHRTAGNPFRRMANVGLRSWKSPFRSR
jgi:hypothetical protein